MTGERARVRAQIRGRVQGVWYRRSAQLRAQALGLTGWVRNRPDGSVELWAEGPRAALDELVAWCWEGPANAHVDDVALEGGAPEGHDAFVVRR
ncbi:MAG: acylphosphatase [Myxococcales bacterium]|nr:acylphosphatase [Myxococcales bacterium]